jgi:hypothetical protein
MSVRSRVGSALSKLDALETAQTLALFEEIAARHPVA